MTAVIRYPFDTPPVRGEAVTVAPGVLWMRLPLPMALAHVNVYALDDGHSWTVIDTGFASHASRKIWEDLLAGPLGGKPVGRVIVTHHHPDHVGLAGWFQTQGATISATRTSWLMARMLTLDVQEVPSDKTVDFWRSAGMAGDMLRARTTSRSLRMPSIWRPSLLISKAPMRRRAKIWTAS